MLARVNLAKQCKKRFGRLNIGEYHMHTYIYLCKNIIGRLNIGDFIQKLSIAKIYSSPIFRLIIMVSRIRTYIGSTKFKM